MWRKYLVSGLITLIILAGLAAPALGQGDPDAWPTYRLRMRTGPGTGYAVVTTLDANTGLALEARNADASWLLAHTLDGSLRGWLASLYMGFADSVVPASLPVSDEVLPAPVAPAAASAPAADAPAMAAAPVTNRALNAAQVASINLHAYPVIPANLGRARAIFQAGQARGNNPHVVAKVGDCASGHPDFLTAFTRPDRVMGQYAHLEGTIAHFGESLGYQSKAAHAGFNSGAILDPTWADPSVCRAGESPLTCEFRLHRPAVAVIMFGTTDLQALSPEQYNTNLRNIVEQTVAAGVIPLLSTFPPHMAYPQESIYYNQIVVQIALDYNIPLVNLWLALEPLPNHGMAADGNHLAEPFYGGPGHMVAQNLQAGLPMRNLVTLQALQAVVAGAMY